MLTVPTSKDDKWIRGVVGACWETLKAEGDRSLTDPEQSLLTLIAEQVCLKFRARPAMIGMAEFTDVFRLVPVKIGETEQPVAAAAECLDEMRKLWSSVHLKDPKGLLTDPVFEKAWNRLAKPETLSKKPGLTQVTDTLEGFLQDDLQRVLVHDKHFQQFRNQWIRWCIYSLIKLPGYRIGVLAVHRPIGESTFTDKQRDLLGGLLVGLEPLLREQQRALLGLTAPRVNLTGKWDGKHLLIGINDRVVPVKVGDYAVFLCLARGHHDKNKTVCPGAFDCDEHVLRNRMCELRRWINNVCRSGMGDTLIKIGGRKTAEYVFTSGVRITVDPAPPDLPVRCLKSFPKDLRNPEALFREWGLLRNGDGTGQPRPGT